MRPRECTCVCVRVCHGRSCALVTYALVYVCVCLRLRACVGVHYVRLSVVSYVAKNRRLNPYNVVVILIPRPDHTRRRPVGGVKRAYGPNIRRPRQRPPSRNHDRVTGVYRGSSRAPTGTADGDPAVIKRCRARARVHPEVAVGGGPSVTGKRSGIRRAQEKRHRWDSGTHCCRESGRHKRGRNARGAQVCPTSTMTSIDGRRSNAAPGKGRGHRGSLKTVEKEK